MPFSISTTLFPKSGRRIPSGGTAYNVESSREAVGFAALSIFFFVSLFGILDGFGFLLPVSRSGNANGG
jgi:hypothetical protein